MCTTIRICFYCGWLRNKPSVSWLSVHGRCYTAPGLLSPISPPSTPILTGGTVAHPRLPIVGIVRIILVGKTTIETRSVRVFSTARRPLSIRRHPAHTPRVRCPSRFFTLAIVYRYKQLATLPYDAVKGVGNAMPFHRSGYDTWVHAESSVFLWHVAGQRATCYSRPTRKTTNTNARHFVLGANVKPAPWLDGFNPQGCTYLIMKYHNGHNGHLRSSAPLPQYQYWGIIMIT